MIENRCPVGSRVSLYQIADWIVSQGGTRRLDTRPIKRPGSFSDIYGQDEWIAVGWSRDVIEAWDAAVVELLQAIQDGEFTVRGFRDGKVSRPLEPIDADEFGYEFSHPFADTPLELILGEKGRYLDLSIESTITDGRTVFWSGLVANGREVSRRWPPATAPDAPRVLSVIVTKPNRIAEWLKLNYPERPQMTIKELAILIRRAAPEIGGFSERTLKSAVKLAYL